MLSVISTNPAKDARDISPAVEIEIIFNEAINTATFSNGMVYIKSKDGEEVDFTTEFSQDALRLTIKPVQPLNAGTAYTVYLSPVDLLTSKTLTATNGDTLDHNYFFDFYTASSNQPADADVPNVYTDPLYNAPFTISAAIQFEGLSTKTGVVADDGVFTADFNTEIDPSSPLPLMEIEAETYQGEMYDPQPNITVTGRHLYVTLANMQPNSRLYIRIPGTLKGTDHTSLTDDVNTFIYTYLSPKPFPASRLLSRLGYKSQYFDDADLYEAAMEAMLTAGAWAHTDFFKYTQSQISPQLSMAFVYLAMGILITRKYLNSAINQNTQIAIDVTTYKFSGMPSDLGAKYIQEGINMLRGLFPVAPALTKHAVRIFRPRWSNKVVFDKPGVNRADRPPAYQGSGMGWTD